MRRLDSYITGGRYHEVTEYTECPYCERIVEDTVCFEYGQSWYKNEDRICPHCGGDMTEDNMEPIDSKLVISEDIAGFYGIMLNYDGTLEGRTKVVEEVVGWANKLARAPQAVEGAPYIRIEMPCGNKVEFADEREARRELLANLVKPCLCGDPKHWFWKFVESNEGENNVKV